MSESQTSQQPESPICAICGTPLAAGRLGAKCPRCLLSLASFSIEEPDETLMTAPQIHSFGDYELLEEIARGGMGVVYRARQLSLGREVAVKMILAGELATTESVQRFRNEAATAARLDHPNIVSVYEIGEHDMQHYFSMRLVLGKRNIAMWARSQASAGNAKSIATMMAKVAYAVAFAHERGVLHRDLKPSNILVDEQGEPQVTDFGLAKLLNEQDSGLTISAVMLGSPSYMAPEQADGRHGDVTTLTDVYGLGAVLYELLTRRPPFTGATPLATAKQVVEQMPAPLTGAPQDLATICLKCLTKEPAQRYASAHELAEDLERFSNGEAIHARSVTVPEAIWRWARRSPKIAALLGLVLMASALGVTGITWQWRRAETANAGLAASVAQLEWRRAVQLLDSGDYSVGMAQLARLLRTDPGNPRVASLAVSVLEEGGFAFPAAPRLSHGQSSIIHEARLSPDESCLATAGSDGTARLWDAATSRPLGATMRHEGAVRWVEFSPDGSQMATASDDGTARLWDARTGAPLSPPLRHEGPVAMARFGPASRLATISADGTAGVWKEATLIHKLELGGAGRALVWSVVRGSLFTASDSGVAAWNLDGQKLFSADAAVNSLALSPDGLRLAGWSPESVHLWDATTGAESDVKLENTTSLLDVAWSPDSKRIAGAAKGAWARIWEAETGRALTPKLNHLYECACVAFSPDGTALVSGGSDGMAQRWDAFSGQLLGARITHREAVMKAVFSKNGDHLLLVAHPWNVRSRPRGGTVQLWDLRHRGPSAWRYRYPNGKTAGAVAWSPDGSRWASHAVGGESTLHAVGQPTVTLPGSSIGGWARGLAFLPDGERLLVVGTAGEFSVWSLADRRRTLGPLQLGKVEGVCLFPDGRQVAIGLLNGKVAIRDTSTGAVMRTLPAHHAPLNCVDVSPDGSLVATAGEDGQCFVSDAATGNPLFAPIQADDEFVSVQFSHDGRWIVTASHDRTVRVWNARTGAQRGPEMRHDGEVAYAQFSPDGRVVLSADRSGAARLWSASTGEPLGDPMRHSTALRHARFSPDGRRIVTEDHTGLRLWETATGEPLTLRQPHPTLIGIGFFSRGQHTAFSPDGSSVLQGTATANVLRWDFPPPPVPAPGWLPELLEAVAGLRITNNKALQPVRHSRWIDLRQKLRALPGEDFYARWARQFCGDVP
jgi:WD40 repeat protein